jgi:circadian clock protein KaiB
VFEHPTEAMDDGVMVTPTLMRLLPTPVRRLIGDLGNQERVLAGLRVEVDD